MKDTELEQHNAINEAVEMAVSQRSRPSVEIDVERYQAYLDDTDLSPEHRREMLEALWTIITAFVELGFGVHPTQQACGKPQTSLDRVAKSESTKPKQDKKNPDTDAPAI